MSSDEDAHDNEIYPHPEAFLIDYNSAPKDLSSMHPEPVQIFRLWQTYLTNCNPLLKFFHAPTIQQVILDASSDLHNVPRHTEALMFSIYLLAVTSLSSQECESMFHLPRTDLLTKYSHAAQQALVNAKFLKSLSLSTLQALCLYLVSCLMSSAYCGIRLKYSLYRLHQPNILDLFIICSLEYDLSYTLLLLTILAFYSKNSRSSDLVGPHRLLCANCNTPWNPPRRYHP